MDGQRRPTLDEPESHESAQALEEMPARDWRFTSGNCANRAEPTRRRVPAGATTSGGNGRTGHVVLDGVVALRENADVPELDLGGDREGRRSFRDIEHDRRRERWLQRCLGGIVGQL